MNIRFRPTDTLEDMIRIVNATDSLFFRLGVWGEVVEGTEHAAGTGLVCQQDLVAIAREIKMSEIQPNTCLQILSGYTFAEESIYSTAGKGERFVYNPILVTELEVPSLQELREIYADFLNFGGITEKPQAGRIVSPDDIVVYKREPKPLTMKQILGDNYPKHAARVEKFEKFQVNWDNLVARKEFMKSNEKMDPKFAEAHPLSENFNAWAKRNWELVSRKLNTDPRLGVLHESGSEQDIIHRGLSRNTHINEALLFPINRGVKHLGIGDKRNPQSFQAFINSLDRKIADWNPRVKTAEMLTRELMDDTDEFGNPIDTENVQPPEIIGEILNYEADNTQFVGLDENGDEVYSDFDHDGLFQPMGNPDNSTDTRDDIDLSDHTEYKAQDWQSIDLVDDHHIEHSFAQECISEQPVYDQKGEIIDWETENHSDQEAPVLAADDEEWLKDAKNWMTRENLMANTDDNDIRENIADAYPVSRKFLDYLAENEVDWAVASERLYSIIGKPDTITTDIEWV